MNLIRSRSEKIVNSIFMLILIILFLSFIYPFIIIIARSFSSDQAIYSAKVWLLPVEFTLSGYAKILEQSIIYKAALNNIIVAFVGTLLSIIVTTITAYPLSKRYLPARKFFMWMVTFPILLSPALISMFVVLRYVNAINTLWALILPSLITPFFVIIIKNYFLTIPESVTESARMDGANEFEIFVKLYVPLSVPVLATILLFYFVMYWNVYTYAVYFITDSNKRTLQVILNDLIFVSQMTASTTGEFDRVNILNVESLKNAIIIISILPMILIYPFIQRYFVSGIMLGSLKE